jgi:N-acetylated-alpha-linked acidic dipeptidase
MTKFGDPGFVTHKAIGQYLTLMLYHLVDDESLPLEPANYGTEMHAWLEELEEAISFANATAALELASLENAIVAFENSAQRFNAQRELALGAYDSATVKELNQKARDFSRGFVSQGGLPGREFYRNLIFAPGIDTGYAPVTFAGITESVVAGNFILAQEFVERTSKAVLVAAEMLGVYLEK